MKNKRFHTHLKKAFLGGFCALFAHTFISQLSQPNIEDNISKIELSSKSKSRQLILSKVSKSKTKSGEAAVIMSDPAMSQKWGLKKTDVARAWNVSQGSRDIVVAVIDTGIDVKHPDIKANLWTNPGETGIDANGKDKSKNGIDDDRNGCVDDFHGCNMITHTGDLSDNHGHGTHIAGIVGAEGGNGVGISGVSPKVSLMILKYYDPKVKGANNLLNTVKAIRYAVAMKKAYGIKKMIINYSGGGLEYSKDEYKAVDMARKAGILFVAAAGNERSNSDVSKYYPASYDLDNIISVNAGNKKDEKIVSSNKGRQTVDITAPGENIYSTLPGNSYGLMTGTSQATAFATGVAALVMANNDEFDFKQVKKYILKTGDKPKTLRYMSSTATRLNSYKALVTLDQGVSATGALAKNTVNMKAHQFAANRDEVANINPTISAPTGQIALFGKSLMKAIKVEADDDSLETETLR